MKNKNWFAIYTKPRCEKKVHSSLLLKEIESYCPLNKIKKKYSDRYKIVEEPLFKSYVFVKLNEEEKTEVRLTNNVVNFVYWLGKPAIISNNDIIEIKKFLKEYDEVSVEKLDLKLQQKIKIDSGLFMGQDGIIKEIRKNKVIVHLTTIGFSLTAEINKKDLVII